MLFEKNIRYGMYGTYVIILYFAWIGGCERKEPGFLRQSTRGDGYNERAAQYRY
jgi:hypothetical protein